MDKKEPKTRLRLVSNTEDQAKEEPQPSHPEPVRSEFARQMHGFADDLDRMIAAILNS